MDFDLQSILMNAKGSARALHEEYMNPVFSNVLEMIGFAHEYSQGEGCYLTTLDGRRILDALSGYGVYGMGRNHPIIASAIKQALDMDLPNLIQMDNSLLSGLLAEKLISIAPGKRLQHVFFTNSGTESVEGAIKFARATNGRKRILYSKGAFHGLSTGSLSLNGDEGFKEGFGDLLPGSTTMQVDDLENVERELKTGTVSAVIIEAIRGKGVYFPKDNQVYPTLQQLCRQYGTLLVIDEIQTGLGRTGKWWACEHWNLEPDILVTAKTLSGGQIPVGAILYSNAVYRKVFSRLDRCVVHSSTFGQNSLAMVAGLATIHVLESDNLIQRSAEMGERLLSGLKVLQEKHEFIHDVRGKGLIVGVEFGTPRSLTLKPAWALLHAAENGLFAQAVIMQMYSQHNILAQVSGHHMEVIKFLPPYIITVAEVDHIVSALDQVMQECKRFPGPIWSVGKQLVSAAAKQHLLGRKAAKPVA